MRVLAALLCAALVAGSGIGTARAADPLRADLPVLLVADELVYDRVNGIATATGNVEASQAGRVLRAERLTYYERSDSVVASGYVALLEPTGEVQFADHVELTDAF